MTDEILLTIWNNIKQDLPIANSISWYGTDDTRWMHVAYFTEDMKFGSIGIDIYFDRITILQMVRYGHTPVYHFDLANPNSFNEVYMKIKELKNDDRTTR